MALALPRITLFGQEWFVDERLQELRAVNNPSDYISPDEIFAWIVEQAGKPKEASNVIQNTTHEG